ncbi:POT-type proton-dependent oligopeptide transporter [Tanticharoenia sakaeratensis]|uniref:Di-/tripeptide transporter n=1 Tax=Tanticharoenia sakaeratensis NBRC 103193 TaxID=1231623 RepID=A0A0D6MMN9_9PROT|nr:MFS transporter [Tanticharoenia sakaeratensis]GAN54934.1 di-/tripeptide transporter [Tanticharoenia sakaeratensis NBRC 103193]GBQ22514.1 amino acid/peptide transporter [Tanticharoenia sakaeratensis NBRC 103193]
MSETSRLPEPARPSDILGHPKGLAVLCITEGFASFAVYGFEALFALYMTHALLRPDRVARVWGYGPLAHTVQALYGPQNLGAPMASAIAGLFLAFMWVTPLFAGILADRGFGRTSLIAAGALLMTFGFVLLPIDRTFLVGLACLLVGYGGIGTLKAQVGALYARDDHRRAAAYQLFSLSVQFAVILAPVLGGWLGAQYGWHAAFMLPAGGMLVAFAVYLVGLRALPPDPAISGSKVPTPPLDGTAWLTVGILVGLLPVLALVLATNMQIFNTYMIWGERHYALHVVGHEMPVSWLISLDGAISVIMTVATLGFWQWRASRGRDPDEIVKMCVGAAIGPFAPLILAFASWHAAVTPGDHRIGLGWALLFHVVNDLGFANVYAIGMALYSRAAPPALNTTLVSMFVLSLFLTNLIVGKLGTLLDRLTSVQFWLMHAGLGVAGFVILLGMTVMAYPLLAPRRG